MGLLKSFNTDENFWILNPQFKNIQPFKSHHNSDKSRGKGKSSKVMWFVAQIADDSQENLFRNVLYDERIQVLSLDFMEDPEFFDDNKDFLEVLIESYQKFHTTAALKALKEFNEKIIERAKFIKVTEYSMDKYEMGGDGKAFKIAGTAKMLDDMMKNTKPIYDQYHQILKSLAEEDEEQQVKGGQNLSLSDNAQI